MTETEVITCFDQFRKVLKALRVAGMKLAIDDFGAGYSGLSLLTRFQPDKIKVDAELVRDIHISGTKQAIVASVVRCCEDLGITVVAEGVETLEEWCWLQSVGIRLFQGFLFSRPCLNGIGEICWLSAPGNGPVRPRTRASSLPVGKLFAQRRQGISYRFRHHGLTVAAKHIRLVSVWPRKFQANHTVPAGGTIFPALRSGVAADGDGDIGPGERQNTRGHFLNAGFADGAVYRQGFRANLQHVALGFIAEGHYAVS